MTNLGPGDLWAGYECICDECEGIDGEHADDCPDADYEPDYGQIMADREESRNQR